MLLNKNKILLEKLNNAINILNDIIKIINNKKDVCKHNERVYVKYKSKKENDLKEKRVENIYLNSSPEAVKAILNLNGNQHKTI